MTLSTNIELYARIKSVMPDDAEVVALCDKYLQKATARANLTLARKHAVLAALGEMGDTRSAAEVAEYMNENSIDLGIAKDGGWSTQGVGYYLRRLRDEGRAVEHEGNPKTYSLAE